VATKVDFFEFKICTMKRFFLTLIFFVLFAIRTETRKSGDLLTKISQIPWFFTHIYSVFDDLPNEECDLSVKDENEI